MNYKKIMLAILTVLILGFVLTLYGAPKNQTKLKVAFIDGHNNTIITEQTIKLNAAVTVPEAPKHEGYVFGGWYISGTNKLITDFQNIEKDLKVEARYIAEKKNIASNEENTDSLISSPQLIITRPTNNTNNVNNNTKNYYGIKFVVDGKGSLTGNQEFNEVLEDSDFYENVVIPTPVADEGYTFIGWDPALPENNARIIGNITYTAVFKDVTAPKISNIIVNPMINNNIGGKTTIIFDITDATGVDLTKTYVMFADGAGTDNLKKESEKVKPALVNENTYKVEFDTSSFVKTNYVGTYNLQFTLVDTLGNRTSTKPKDFNKILIDNSGPTSVLVTPINNSIIKDITRFNFEVTDDSGVLSGYMKLNLTGTNISKQYNLVKSEENIWYADINLNDIEDGTYTIDARFIDSFNTPRYGSKKGTIILDTTLPTVEVSYSTREIIKEDIIVTLKFSEEVKPLSGWEQDQVDKTIWRKTYNVNATEAINYEDLAGNPGEPAIINVNNIDKNSPQINYVYYKNDWEEKSWSTGTTKSNPTTTMRVRFKVLDESDIEVVKVIWTNQYNVVEGQTKLQKAILNDINLDGLVEVTKESNGYYYTTAPSNIEGTYKLGIIAIDKAGNKKAWTAADMHFKLPDLTPPTVEVSYSTREITKEDVIITLNFSEEVKPLSGWEQDEADKTIWRKTYNQDASEILNYEDMAGNPGEAAIININNIDKESPVITFSGNNPLILGLGDITFHPTKFGAVSAIDNKDGNITNKIKVTYNDLNYFRIGRYTITYEVTDRAGNTTISTRIVEVRYLWDL